MRFFGAGLTAYYNEIDPFKAEVLREAIRAGAIAPGDVDERSIVNVEPNDLVGYAQCHFFAGGGFWSLALRQAGWPTPMAGTPATDEYNEAGNNDSSRKTVELAAWTTPAGTDGERAGTMTDQMTGSSLTQKASLVGPVRLTAFGEMLTGLDAEMESGGQLNPAHSRWLMGVPPAWDGFACTAMQSVFRRRGRLSKRASRQ